MPRTILTDVGETLIAAAIADDSAVAITHIALGDGAAYDPEFDQRALKRERARMAIESRIQLDVQSWKVKAVFPPETEAIMVREIGFFNADNQLIALWAGADVDARQTGIAEYVVDHVLHFSRALDGLVIVDAPDDALFEFAAAMLAEQASARFHMFNMNEQLRIDERY